MRAFILIAALFLNACAHSSAAPEHDFHARAQSDAQTIIDACWAISQDDRDSGVTSRMREGGLNTALCMEHAFLDLISKHMNKDDAEAQKRYADNIETLRMSYGRIIWDLYNDHDGCDPMCGTMFHVFHNGVYAHLLEDLLLQTSQQIVDYELAEP